MCTTEVPPNRFAFDNRHLQSCVCQPNRKRRSCLTSANNDRIIFSCHGDTSARITVLKSSRLACLVGSKKLTSQFSRFVKAESVGLRSND